MLVDRLWPRGVNRDYAALDNWAKDIAPSNDLREWFDHDLDRWEEFRSRYRDELAGRRDLVRQDVLGHTDDHLTLVYTASDETHNSAVVLAEFGLKSARKRKWFGYFHSGRSRCP